jgi:hypothetical protein
MQLVGGTNLFSLFFGVKPVFSMHGFIFFLIFCVVFVFVFVFDFDFD